MIPAAMLSLIDELAADGRISASEVIDVRRVIFPDGAVTRMEAEFLFHLNERIDGENAEWDACFAEAVCDHLLLSTEPQGHVSNEGGDWLDARIREDGLLKRRTELEVLLKLVERAESCPPSLILLTRESVAKSIVEAGGRIGEAEVALIRRMLFAAAGDGATSITHDEAEWLFQLDAATQGLEHSPAWRDLFVKANLNHLFVARPSALLDRDAMMRRAAPHKPGALGLQSILRQTFEGVADGGLEGYAARVRQNDAYAEMFAHVDAREAEAEAADALDDAESEWIVTRVAADGHRSGNEQALIDAIKAAKGDDALKTA